MSKTGMGGVVPSAAACSAPPAADRTALIWGCFVAEFLGAVIVSFQLCSLWELGRGGAGWRMCPAMLEEFSGVKPEATITEKWWSCFLTRVNLCRGIDICEGHHDWMEIWPVTGCGYSMGKLQPTHFPLDRDAWGHFMSWIGLCSELLESLMREIYMVLEN